MSLTWWGSGIWGCTEKSAFQLAGDLTLTLVMVWFNMDNK